MKLSDFTVDKYKGHYLAFVLSHESRAELLQLFPPTFSKVICHHVTLDFNPTPESVAKLSELDENDVWATGIASGDHIECISIRFGDTTKRLDGSFYHVTLSLESPAKPVDSNKLEDKIVRVRGFIKVKGSFALVKK